MRRLVGVALAAVAISVLLFSGTAGTGAYWYKTTGVATNAALGTAAVSLVTPVGSGSASSADWSGTPLQLQADSSGVVAPVYAAVSGPPAILRNAGVALASSPNTIRSNDLRVAISNITVTADDADEAGLAKRLSVAWSLIGTGTTCNATNFGTATFSYSSIFSSSGTSYPMVSSADQATNASGGGFSLTMGSSQQLCARYSLAAPTGSTPPGYGRSVTATYTFLGWSAGGGTFTSAVSWTHAVQLAYVPPPVAQSGAGAAAACNYTTSGVRVTAVRLNWAWPTSTGFGSGGADPDSFTVVNAVTGTDLMNGSLRTFNTGYSASGALGLNSTFSIRATVNGIDSTAMTVRISASVLLLGLSCVVTS